MPASKHLKILSVRMPDSELRRIKSLAAERGVSLQEAVRQALDVWASPALPTRAARPFESFRGILADTDLEGMMRRDREAELAKDRRWLND